MPNDPQSWFESIWTLRDETLYRAFFGTRGEGIYAISQGVFDSMGAKQVDPRFLTHGVFECPPEPRRGHWLYVSSGMSNPWGMTPETARPDEYSGLGYEFVVHTRERARWAIQFLHWVMAVQLLVACGQAKGELLQPHDRFPLGGSLGKKDGAITHVLVATPEMLPGEVEGVTYPPQFELPSGKVDLLLLLGVTAREADFARTQGSQTLLELLGHQDFLPFTDPGRASAL